MAMGLSLLFQESFPHFRSIRKFFGSDVRFEKCKIVQAFRRVDPIKGRLTDLAIVNPRIPVKGSDSKRKRVKPENLAVQPSPNRLLLVVLHICIYIICVYIYILYKYKINCIIIYIYIYILYNIIQYHTHIHHVLKIVYPHKNWAQPD